LFEHHMIDIYCAVGIMKHIAKATNTKLGALTFMAGSLHAFQWSLKEVKRF
jgi:thymidylate synthase